MKPFPRFARDSGLLLSTNRELQLNGVAAGYLQITSLRRGQLMDRSTGLVNQGEPESGLIGERRPGGISAEVRHVHSE